MYKFSTILCLCSLFLACSKDKPLNKSPLPLAIRISVLDEAEEHDRAGDFSFEEGSLELKSIGIEGKRLDGDDFLFVRELDANQSSYQLALGSSNLGALFDFDIPKGRYSSLQLCIETKAGEQGINIAGTYDFRNPNWDDIALKLEVAEEQRICIDLLEGQSERRFIEEELLEIEVQLNLPYWLDEMNSSLVRQALGSMQTGTRFAINAQEQRQIYENILARIGRQERAAISW